MKDEENDGIPGLRNAATFEKGEGERVSLARYFANERSKAVKLLPALQRARLALALGI